MVIVFQHINYLYGLFGTDGWFDQLEILAYMLFKLDVMEVLVKLNCWMLRVY